MHIINKYMIINIVITNTRHNCSVSIILTSNKACIREAAIGPHNSSGGMTPTIMAIGVFAFSK